MFGFWLYSAFIQDLSGYVFSKDFCFVPWCFTLPLLTITDVCKYMMNTGSRPGTNEVSPSPVKGSHLAVHSSLNHVILVLSLPSLWMSLRHIFDCWVAARDAICNSFYWSMWFLSCWTSTVRQQQLKVGLYCDVMLHRDHVINNCCLNWYQHAYNSNTSWICLT